MARIQQDDLDTDPDEIKQTILEIVATTRDYLTELLQIAGSTIRDDFLSPDYPDSWLLNNQDLRITSILSSGNS
ncbi:hypothetical protein [Planktothricoides raciborskii]|uniref:Uncharacterized protein n=1 Tax=Planktothricoides raciborskii GIHE-MW2 TaxID=2792601 RepID=A0AAU8JBL3_9CYAN